MRYALLVAIAYVAACVGFCPNSNAGSFKVSMDRLGVYYACADAAYDKTIEAGGTIYGIKDFTIQGHHAVCRAWFDATADDVDTGRVIYVRSSFTITVNSHYQATAKNDDKFEKITAYDVVKDFARQFNGYDGKRSNPLTDRSS